MDVELGLFWVDPGRLKAFDPVADDIRQAFRQGGIDGMRSFHMTCATENPSRWAVIAAWDSVEDHTRFADSPEGQRQRRLLNEFMTGAPEVLFYHFDDVREGLR